MGKASGLVALILGLMISQFSQPIVADESAQDARAKLELVKKRRKTAARMMAGSSVFFVILHN